MNPRNTPPPPVSILGIGAITPIGRDLNVIARALALPTAKRSEFLRVPDNLLADPAIARSMRRADRFIRLAAIAAMDAWMAGREFSATVPKEQIGLIVTSGLGPHCRGFKFLDGILDAGDSAALPTDFSHSVHGAAASYIAGMLDLRGPSLTTTDFEIGFEQSVLLAQSWLQEGVCQRVLVGAVEELGEPMTSIAGKMLEGREEIVPGEGALFLLLGAQGTGHAPWGTIDGAREPEQMNLAAIEWPGIIPGSPSDPQAKRAVTFTPYFGHSATASALGVLGAALSVSHRHPLGQTVSEPAETSSPAVVDNATTFRTSCGIAATLHITDTHVHRT